MRRVRRRVTVPAFLPITTTSSIATVITRRLLTTGLYGRTQSCYYAATRLLACGVNTAGHSRLGMDGFTDVTYNTAADGFLENIDNILEDIAADAIDDVNLSGGVLTIETTSRGTFVLNKQAPNVQLWLSSPISGPHHYDMILPENSSSSNNSEDVQWLADSDGHSLKERLEKELTEVLGVEVRL
ncbi:frataxin-like, mitochondrial precursor [Trypanosoma theileri]|uniref:ferroxidase n=1 Tax=Trypanosoma theileri TaxID=67003 RepID=A0A1X0NLP7_9TRYP|nr:frataxin-like, mitochondrial precursor [Trypanosoma theileri]ORC85692.1 frataxin-like, mitochondrial precursor [Trypanosoma theileri]